MAARQTTPNTGWRDIEVFDVRYIEDVLGPGIATPVRQLSQSPSPHPVPPTPRLSPFTFHRLCLGVSFLLSTGADN